MKWLVLILIVSCGKHQSPPAVDLLDADGDQILNYQEASEIEKNLANFEPLGAIKGSLKFLHHGTVELAFSNSIDHKNNALGLITGRDDDTSHREYFSEWSHIEFEKKIFFNDLKNSDYTLHLQFETTGTTPEEVVLITPNERLSLGQWEPNLKIKLSSQGLASLLEGTSKLAFRKKFRQGDYYQVSADQSIKDNTYRIYFFDGEKSNVYYAARSLPYERFKQLKAVKHAETYVQDEIFFNGVDQSPQWYEREFQNGDKALVYASPALMRESLLKRFEYRKRKMIRINGAPQNMKALRSFPGAIIYLEISALNKTMRTFQESELNKNYRVGSLSREGYEFNCRHRLRHIKEEKIIPATIEDFFSNSHFTNTEFKRVEETINEQGPIWKMRFESLGVLNQLGLNFRDPATFVITGEYAPSCQDNGRVVKIEEAYQTNNEAQLTYVIESYVEKL